MNDNLLLDVVDELSLPGKVKVAQSDGERSWTVDAERVPLLIQLRDAVAGGIGSHGGSALGSERMPIDAGALELFDEIAGQVSEWYLAIPQRRQHLLVTDRLRAWYVFHVSEVRAGRISEVSDRDALELVTSWVARIRLMFDPPIRLDFTELVDGRQMPAACPVVGCGARYAIDARSGDRVIAVVLEYREAGAETLDGSVGKCRACGREWVGRFGVRELAHGINEGRDAA